MWYIFYNHEHNLTVLASNIPQYTGSKVNSIACNRVEDGTDGLHFKGKSLGDCKYKLMSSWVENCVADSKELPLVNYNGSMKTVKLR
jgi:hypothetical protein